jgi:hypothetical protein
MYAAYQDRHALGARAALCIDRGYNLEHIGSRLLNLYQQLAPGKDKTRLIEQEHA